MIELESAGPETGSKGENLASDKASGVGSGAAETKGRTGGPDLPIRHVDSVELLLRGAYERDGFDLVIRGQDGQVQVIEDYFGQLQTPTLLHGGAGLSPVMVRSLLTTPFPEGVQFAGPASGALGPAIGRVTLVRGEVKVTHADGSEDTLRRGDPIYRGDVVETGPNAFLLARMNDGNGPRGTAFSLGRNGRASFDEFDFVDDPDPDKDVGNFEATVFVGGFRYRSGALGSLKPISAGSHSVIRTPTAFIGIRGSELEGNVADDGETLVVHRDGVLDIFDINQQNDPVVLDTPGNTSFVLTDGSATKFAQPTAQQAATVEAALPPPISTTGEDDPNADEPDRDEAADTTPDETPAGPARPDGTPEDEAAEEEVQPGEDVEEEAEEDAEESEDDEEEDAERDVPDEDAEDAEGRAPPADEAPAEQQADQPAEPANTPAPPPAPAEETLSQQDQQEEREQVEQESTSQNTQEESPTPTQTTPERPPAPPQEELPPPDNPPEAMDDVFEVNADISATLDVLANDTDPNLGQTLQIAEVDTSGISGDVTIVDGNTLTYTPPEGLESLPAGESVQEVFAYSVTSGLLEDKAEVTVTVLGVNDAPTSADVLGVSASEDSSVPLSGSMFPFTDVDAGAELNGVRISSVEGGQLILGDVPIDSSELIPAGDLDNLVFIPEPNLNGTGVAGFLFSVGDGDLESDQHAFRFDISPIPDAPLTMADSYTLTESGSLEVPASEGVLANDTDIDGDGVTVTSFQVLSDVGGSLQIDADGALTFIPDRADFAGLGANDSATVDIEYTATGAGGESAVGEVSITVTGENAAPVAGDDAFSVAASDVGVRFDLLDNDDDPEGDPISIVAAGAGAEGNVALDGTVFYTPGAAFSHLAAGEQGTDEFLYTISDGDLTDGGRVVVTVTRVNDAPIARDDGISVSEDAPLVEGNLLDNDEDPDNGDSITFLNFDAPNVIGGLSVGSDGSFTYEPDPTFQSLAAGETLTETFTYTIEDSMGVTSGATATITVVGANDDPSPESDSVTTDEDTPVQTGNVLANDQDIDLLDALTVVDLDLTGTMGSAAVIDGGILQYDPRGAFDFLQDGQVENDVFHYVLSDGTTTINVPVTVTINGVNDPATAVDDSGAGFTVTEDTPMFTTANVLDNDTDPDDGDIFSLIASSADGTDGQVINLEDGTFEYIVPSDANALRDGETRFDTFTYVIAGSDAELSQATVKITLVGVNDRPVAVDDSGPGFETGQGQSFVTGNVLLNDFDPDDGDVLSVAGVGSPLGIDDLTAGTDAIVGTDDTTAGTETTSGSSLILDGTIGEVTDLGDGTFLYDPNGMFGNLGDGETATDQFTYIVTDGIDTDTATVTIVITGGNEAPTATDDSGTGFIVGEDDTLTTPSLLLNDTDPDSGDTLEVVSLNLTGTQGTVSLQGDGSVIYGPGPSFNALPAGATELDTFTYTIEDPAGLSDVGTVTIEIVGTNDNPDAQDDSGLAYLTDSGTAFQTGNVLLNDSDVDLGDELTITSVDTTNTQGNVTDNGDGTFTYDPAGAFDSLGTGQSATDTFTYEVSDGQGGVGTAVVTISIQGGVLAETVFLNNAADDSWQTPANWTFAELPVAGQDVLIDGFDVNYAGGASDQGVLTVRDSNLFVTAGDLSAQILDSQNSVIDIADNASFAFGGNVTIGFQNQFAGLGVLELLPNAAVTVSALSVPNELHNSGDLAFRDGLSSVGGPFDNDGEVRLISDVSANVTVNVAEGFNNRGLLILDNEYAVNSRSETLTVTNGMFTNSGTVQTLRSGAGSIQRINAQSIEQMPGGIIDIDDTLQLHYESFNASEGTVDIAASEALDLHASIFNAGVTFGSSTNLTGAGMVRFFGTQTVTLDSPFSVTPGTPVLDSAGAVLTFTGAALTVEDGADFVLTTDTVNSDFVNRGATVVRDSTSNLNGAVTNTGTMRLESYVNAHAYLNINSAFSNDGTILFDNIYDSSARDEVLTVTGGLTNNGVIQTQNSGGAGGSQRIIADFVNGPDGMLDVDHSLTIRGDAVDLSAGTVDVAAGQLLQLDANALGATFTLGSASNLIGAGSIRFGGTITLNLVSPFELTATSTTLDLSLASVTITGAPFSVGAGGAFELSAETVTVDFSNAGSLFVRGNTSTLSGAFANSGEVTLEGTANAHATLTVENGFTNTGLVAFDNVYVSSSRSQTLNVTGGALTNDGTLRSLSTGLNANNRVVAEIVQTEGGLIDVDQSLTIRSATFDGALGTLDVADGHTLTFESSSSSSVVNLGPASALPGAGSIRFTGTQTLNFTAPFEVTDSDTSLDLTSAFVTLTGMPLSIGAGGSFLLTAETVNADVNNAGTLTVRSSTNRLNQGFSNTGTFALEGTASTSVNLVVASGFVNAGLILMDNIYASSGRSQTLTVENGETLTNDGTIRSQRSGAGGTNQINAEFTQTANGIIDVDHDLIIRSLGFDASLGQIDVADGQVLTLNSTQSTAVVTLGSASTLTGGGTIRFSGTQTINFASPFELTETSTDLDLGSAFVTLTGSALTIGAGGFLELTADTVNVDLTNNGWLRVVSNTSTLNGTFGNGGTLTLEGTTGASASLVVAGGFTNTGLITLDNTYASAARSATLTLNTGTLVNDGTVRSMRSGAGGNNRLNAEIEQTANGVIDVDHNLNIRGFMQNLRLGTLDVDDGQVLLLESNGTGSTVTLGTPATMPGGGTIRFSGNQIVNFADPFDLAATTTNFDLSIANLTLTGADLTVGSGGMLMLTSDTVNLELSNEGQIRVEQNTSVINSAAFVTRGMVDLIGTVSSNVTLIVENGFTNAGTLRFDNEYASSTRSQTLTINNGTLTNDGTILSMRSGAGGTQRINADVTQSASGVIDADHSLRIRSVAFDGSLGTIDVASGETLTFEAQTSSSVVTLGSASTLVGDGAIVLSGGQTLNFSSPFELTSTSTTLDLSPSTITITGADFTIGTGGAFTLTAETVNTVLNNEGLLTVQGNTSNVGGAFDNSGTLSIEGTVGSSVTLTVADGFTNSGTIRMDNLYASSGRSQTLNVTNGTLINDGTIETWRSGAGGTQTIDADITQTANGLIDVDQDATIRSLNFDSSLGSINVETGHTLTLQAETSSAVVTLGSSSNLTGDGRILFSGNQTLNLASPFELTATSVALDFASGAITIAGADLTVGAGGSLVFRNDTVNSNFQNAGTFRAEPGTSTFNGTVNNSGTLEVQGTSSGTATLTLNNGLNNTGVIELDNVYASAGRTQNLNVDGATFVNDGTIRTLRSGAGGNQNINAEITQTANGLIDVDKDVTIRTLAFDTSLGTINVRDGHTLTIQADSATAVTTFGSAMTLTGTGRILFSGTQSIDIASPTTLPAAGADVDLGSGSVTINGAALTIEAGATLPVTADTINSDLNVNGMLLVLPGTSHFNGTALTNAGTIRVEGTAAGSSTININAGFTNDGTIVMDNTYASATRSQTLIVTGGPIVNNGTISTVRTGAGGTQTITADITQTAAGTINIDKDVTLNPLTFDASLGTIHVDSSHTFTIDGQSSSAVTSFGSGTMLTGTGRILFNGAQVLNFSSPTTLPAAGAAVDLSGGAVTITGAEVTIETGASLGFTSETVSADVNNEGTLKVQNGITTFNASSLMNSGTLAIEGVAAGSATFIVNTSFTNSGLITFDNVYASATRNQTFDVNGTLTNDGTIQTLLTGAGGNRTFTGDITQGASGVIDIDRNLTLNHLALDLSLGTLDVDSGRTLTVNAQNSSAVTTFAGGAFAGDGTVAFSGPQTINFEGAPTTLTNLTFNMVPATVTLGGTGSLHVDGTATLLVGGGTVNTPVIDNNGTFRVQNGTTTFNTPSITNNAAMHIEGTQAGSTTASFTAGLVNIGTLTFDNVYAAASRNVTVNVSGGALENQGTLNVIRTGAAGTFTLNAALDNSGSVNVDKNITLAGNTISHTNQAGGTITVQDGHTLTIQGTGSTFTNDGTITLMGVSGVSSATTILDVTGIGTFQNNGSITGIGTVNGSVLGNAPTVGSSPGIVTINGDYTMAATSEFEVELAGEDPAIGYDVLDVRDTASVDGALRVELLNGFTPRAGATFAVLTAGLVAGGFTRVDGLEEHGSLVLDLAYTDNSVTLTAIPVTHAGTASADVVAGTDGRDIVTAGAGDDVVLGLGVRDVAYGGPGDDTFVVDSGFERVDGGSGIDTLVLGPDTDVSALAMRVDRVEELRLDGADLVLTPHTAAGLVDANGDDTAALFLTGAGTASLVGWEVAGTEEVAHDGGRTGFVLFEAEGVTLYADADAVADGSLAVTMDDAIDLSGLDALAASTFAQASVPDLADVLDADDASLDALLGETESGQLDAANPPADDAPLLLVGRPDLDSLFDNAATVFAEV